MLTQSAEHFIVRLHFYWYFLITSLRSLGSLHCIPNVREINCRWLVEWVKCMRSKRKNGMKLWCFMGFSVLGHNLWLSFACTVSTWARFIALWQAFEYFMVYLSIWFVRIVYSVDVQWSARSPWMMTLFLSKLFRWTI